MVGIKIQGQLGNHMFQYAFIQATSKKLNTNYFIIYGKTKNTIPRLSKYFNLKNNRILSNFIFSKINTNKLKINIDSFNQPENELLKLRNNAIYEGFTQSEKYFSFANINPHEIFNLKKKYIRQFNNKYQSIFHLNKTIVVHVRLGDYAYSGADFLGGKDIRLPLNYYVKALNQINNLNEYQVIFVSDEIEYCRKHFSNYNNCIFESNGEIIDMQLIMNADIAIISNSTFSWWGAYLNSKPQKIIFAPQYWLGFMVKKEFPAGITSVQSWNWI